MRRIAPGTAQSLAVAAASLLLGIIVWLGLISRPAPFNLDFESGIVGRPPAGWQMKAVGGNGFQAVLVDRNCPQGRNCVMLSGPASPAARSFINLYAMLPPRSSAAQDFRFGAPYQIVNKDPQRARRIRYRAAVRVEGANTRARLWFRIERREGGRTFQKSPDIIGAEWNYYTIDADVAAGAQQIAFGFVLCGPGRAWVDDASFTEL
ncbi:MAG: hypothetical protein ACRD8O_18635 [Bryobacteraceae bacterium]